MSRNLSRFMLLLLSVANLLSALMVVQSTYQSRVLVDDLRDLRAKGDLLAAQQERLDLDYAWWAGQTRVDRDARQLLGMVPVQQVQHLAMPTLAGEG